MAIDYFQPESFQQANPILSGMSAGQQIIGQGIQNAFMPQTLAQQLQQLQLQNMQAKAVLPYAGPQAAANVGLTGAQTGLLGAQAQYFPLTAAGQYYGGLGRYMQGTFNWSPAHSISLFQNDPGFQSMVAGNPGLRNQIANIMANSSTGGGINNPAMGGSPQIPNTANPAMPTANMGGQQTTMPMTPQQLQTLAALRQQIQNGGQQGTGILNNSVGQTNQIPNQNQTTQGTALTPADYQNFGNSLQSAALKKTNTSQILNQRQYSQILDPLLEQGAQLMPSVAKYSGVMGHLALLRDRSMAAAGANTPDYTNYTIFTNTVAPNAANEMRRVLGGQATDSERQVMDNLVDPTYWHSNPDLAMAQYKSLVDLYQKTVNPALAKSPAQVQQTLQQGGSSVPQTTNSPAAPQATKVLNGNTYVKINGKWFQQ